MPDWKPHIRPRLASLRLSPTRENEIIEELSQHLEDRWRELVADGVSGEEATRLALGGFRGGDLLAQHLASLRQAHAPVAPVLGAPTERLLGDLRQDISYAWRMLWRHSGFTVAAVVMLALGIGATTAIFSTVYAVLLQPLPYREPARLVAVLKKNPPKGWSSNPVAPADVVAWRDQARVFEGLAAFAGASCVLTGSTGAEEVPCEVKESRLFPLLGVTPFIGRTFTSDEDRVTNAPAAILSYGLWQRRFGADPATIGRAIVVNANVYTVVGVMPAGFSHLYSPPYAPVPQLWISGIALEATSEWNTYLAVGRLRPGVTPEAAQAELDAVSEQVERAHPTLKGWRAELRALREANSGDTAPALLVLVAAVIFVLLIASANVANLLLARGTARASEMAVRKALGADRWRVLRQLLTESALLALAGGALGLVVATWGIRALLTLAPSYLLNSARGLSGQLDIRILLLAVGISMATTLLFGLAPAWLSARPDVAESLKETSRGAVDPRSHWFRNVLLVVQVALAVVLLVGAGLMVRTLRNMSAVVLGFNPADVLTLRVPLEGSRYAEPARVVAFWRDVVKAVEALPGVSSASATRGLPTEGWSGNFFVNADRPNPFAGEVPDANYVVVGPRYFETMLIPLRAGRPFDDRDTAGGQPVAIVNEELARVQWPGQSAIGKRIKMGSPSDTRRPWLTVVGVAGGVMTQGPLWGVHAEIYVPYQQFPWLVVPQHLVVRASPGTSPASLTHSVVGEIRRLDRDLPAADVRTMEEVAAMPMGQQRMVLALLAGFAGVALVLAALGIFSVLSYSVGQRQRELGVRVALGAQQADVVRLVVGSGARLAMVGLGVGVIAAWLLTRLMAGLLYGVAPADPLTFLTVAALLGTTALVACYVPARRAMRVNPVDVLRH